MSEGVTPGLSAAEEAPPTNGAAAAPAPTRLIDRPQPLWRVVLVLAFPVLVQQALILSVGLSDRFLAGRLQPLSREEQAEESSQTVLALGTSAGALLTGDWAALLGAGPSWERAQKIAARHVAYQAAQTTAIYFSWLINGYTVLVSVGATALVARFVGARDQAGAVRVTNQAVLLSVVLGVLASAVGLVFLERFVDLLQLRGDAAVFAADYLRPLLWLLVFQVIEAAGIAALIGAGDTRTGSWVLGGVAALNLPLAWGFFQGMGPFPELRFVGIAVGTAVSHTLGGVAVLLVLLRGRAGLRLRRALLRPDWKLQARMLRIGLPAGADSLTIMAGHLWFLSLVNRLGETASSAHGIALGWEALSYLSGAAFGTAAMTLVGQNLGARRPAEAARSGWVAFGMGGTSMVLMGAVFYVFAPEMFRLFCPYPEQQPVVEAGVDVLRLEAFAEPALASIIIFLYAMRGAGDTRVPVLLNGVGLFGIRVPLAYVFTQWVWQLGLYGAWLAMVIDLFARGVLFLVRFAGGRWQEVRV